MGAQLSQPALVPPVALPPACSLRRSAGAGPVSSIEGQFSGVATNRSLPIAVLSRLYHKYATELARLRKPAQVLCAELRASDKSFCASDDIESEITYMRVREAAPAAVLELAPRAGYSTFFLLAAQRATGAGGVVHSYDLENVLQRGNLTAALQLFGHFEFEAAHVLHVGDA